MCDVIVWDDDALVRLTLAEALRDAHFAVEDAASTFEVLKLVRKAAGAKILFIGVPPGGRASALALANEAQAELPRLRLVFGIDSPGHATAFATDRRRAVAIKPFQPQTFIEIANRLLRE